MTAKVSRLAVATKVFPLFEIKGGSDLIINEEPANLPVVEYLKLQGRYRGITDEQIETYQAEVDERWNWLKWIAKYRTVERDHVFEEKRGENVFCR
jgi:pyruvate/2-oxoacid:ferredoxin oxidoreductase beta subunit